MPQLTVNDYNKDPLLQELLMTTHSGLLEWDLDSNQITFNESGRSILWLKHSQIHLKEFLAMITGSKRKDAIRSLTDLPKSGEDFIGCLDIRTADDTIIIELHIPANGESGCGQKKIRGFFRDVSLDKDKEREQEVIRKVNTLPGGARFFEDMANLLCAELNVDYVLIAEFFGYEEYTRTVAFSHQGVTKPNFSYPLEGTPCGKVYYDENLVISTNVQEEFPEDQDLVDLSIQGYIGAVLSHNNVLCGHLAFLTTTKVENPEFLMRIMEGIRERTIAEIRVHRGDRELSEYERSFSISNNIKFILNFDGEFKMANPVYFSLTGYSIEELDGKSLLELVPEDEVSKVKKELEWVIRRKEIRGVVTKHRTARGYYLDVMWSALVDQHRKLIYVTGMDITDSMKAQTELIDTQNRLENIIQYANAGIAYATKDANVVKANKKFAEILEYDDPEDIIGLNISDYTYPDDLQKDLNYLQEVKEGKRDSFEIEKRYVTRTGKVKWVNLRVSALRDTLGEIEFFVAMAIDITEKKESELEMSLLTKRLSLATDSARIGIWDWDVVNNTLDWSDLMFEIFDVAKESFEGNYEAWEKTAHPEDLPRVAKELEETITGEAEFDSQFRIFLSNKEIRYIKANAIAIRNDEGQAIRLIGLNYDITKEVMLRKSIELSEQKYRQLVEHMNEGLLMSRVNGEIEFVNSGFCNTVGYTKEELVGKVGYFLMAGDLEINLVKNKNKLRQEGISDQYEVRMKRKDGDLIWVKISSSPRFDQQGNFLGSTSVILDISKEKEIELIRQRLTNQLEKEVQDRTRELKEAQTKLKEKLEQELELNRLKSKFVSTASHQFRTPLTIIRSNSDLISAFLEKADLGVDDKKMLRKLQSRIDSQVMRMTNLMNDVLNLDKINEGKIVVKSEPCMLSEICKSVLKEVNGLLEDNKKVTMLVEGDERKIKLDDKLMHHAISNFVTNAVKYSNNCAMPELRLIYEKERVLLLIKDYGIGIPEEDLKYFFTPFFRSKNVDGISGTGLGTSIAKEYVELNRGSVNVESSLGRGTEILIELGDREVT